ncbi:putative domain present in cyclins, TFIIB and Retinoblastoma [Trypoxylus dichotomus]
MANSDEKWYFSKERLENSPSRQCGIENYKELSYRQQAANFIQDMGQKLKVSQLCINTAIVYMHRFYVFHSFTQFPWASIASASIFLAAKVEEQPRKLEHVIKYANLCKNPHDTRFEINSERYQAQSQDLVFNENILLQTLGFDVAIDHPHTHVVRCCHLVRASKDLAQTSYFMASNSLHLTTMCLQYKPTVVACFCIHLVCKWSNWEIPLSNEKREWFSYVDSTVTADLLKQLTEEFLTIFERCPSRLKEKIMAIGGYSPFESEKKLAIMPDNAKEEHHRQHHDNSNKSGSVDDSHKPRPPRPHDGSVSSGSCQQSLDREYREKREAERMARYSSSKPAAPNTVNKQPLPHGHHRPPVDPKVKPHGRPPSSGYASSANRPDAHSRDLLREAARDIGLMKEYREQSREFAESSRDNVKMSSGGSRDLLQVRNSDKELLQQQKRDSMLKPNVSSDGSSYMDKQRGDMQRLSSSNSSNRSSIDPNKLSSSSSSSSSQQHINKHEPSSGRHPDDSTKQLQQQPHVNEIKKHLSSAGVYDKSMTSSFLNKSMNATSRNKTESPFTASSTDVSKSVPKMNSMNSSSVVNAIKSESHNGSNTTGASNSYLPVIDDKIKIEIKSEIKEEIVTPQKPNVVKKPSLFSPEKTSPIRQKTPPLTRSIDIPTTPSTSHLPPTISPFNSPDAIAVDKQRNRTLSSSSEPELRPVMKKIDQVEGFENLLRDPSIGIKVNHHVPDIITPIADTKSEKINNQLKEISKEMKAPDLIPPFTNPLSTQSSSQTIVNGIETNATLISNLLKESHAVSHLPTITSPVDKVEVKEQPKEKDHHHKERKKKNKEKHKHKDKDRSKEDKERKKKHKDKDREKHKDKSKEKEKQAEAVPPAAQPIKITISKDKIQPPDPAIISAGLKIKIPKDRLKPDTISNESTPTAPLKIKISKEVINNYSGESKKRERDKTSPRDGGPPAKMSKSSHNRSSDTKPNGRSSYNKVSAYSNNSNINSNHNNSKMRPQPQQQVHQQSQQQHFNSSKMQSNVACMSQPPPAMQPNFFYPPPYNMPLHMHPNMNVPPPPQYMYQDPQMYLYGNGGYPMYSGLYSHPPPPAVGGAPPLPQDAPPDVPPPPPPEV